MASSSTSAAQSPTSASSNEFEILGPLVWPVGVAPSHVFLGLPGITAGLFVLAAGRQMHVR